MAVTAGTVHAFVGENGAGKSTLGKIIAGVFPQDQGDLVLRGTTVSFRSPREALTQGIALVAQEVSLVPRLTAAENVFLGAEPRRAGFIERRTLRERFDRLVADAGFKIRAGSVVGRLPLAQQQQVEILRALAREADLIVLDEPSASLSATEIERLHEVVRSLRTQGKTVILVSHFLGEVLELADVVTVLRDGRVVRTGPIADETEASLVTGMLGRPAGRAYPPKQLPSPDAPVALAVEGLVGGGRHRRLADPSCRRDRRPRRASSAPAGPSSPGRSTAPNPVSAGQVLVRDAPARPAAGGLDQGGRRDDPRVAQGRRADPPPPDPRERQPDQPRPVPALRLRPARGRARGGALRARPGGRHRPRRRGGRVAVRRQPAEAPASPDRCSSTPACSSPTSPPVASTSARSATSTRSSSSSPRAGWRSC